MSATGNLTLAGHSCPVDRYRIPMRVKFRVTSVESYLAGQDVRVKVTLAVVHSGQPPWPVAGTLTLDLEEAGHFRVGDSYGIVFDDEADDVVPEKEPFAFQMLGSESLAQNVERLAAEFVEWANR